MTIGEKAHEYEKTSYNDTADCTSFTKGAEWMLDKACEWFNNFISGEAQRGCISYEYAEYNKTQFKQAMEGEQ